MTSSTLLFLPSDFFPKLIESSESIAVGFVQIIFKTTLVNLMPYLSYILGGIFILLIIASINALFGKVGMLGSLLYHIFYFAILAIVVWINGIEIFFNPFFDLICFIAYCFCYWLVGLILQKFR